MRANPRYATTAALPKTVEFLTSELESILKCRCENPDNLPFSKEVRDTELGHLFEHVLLEYLCDEKINSGCDAAVFRGDTFWEIKKKAPHEFLIRIQIDISDSSLLAKALKKANFLMEKLFDIHTSNR